MATLNNVITNANGCVGIGTSSPAQLLELKKTTGSAIALLNYNDDVKFNINASSAGVGYVGMVSNHDLLFVTNDTERARLNTNGNLGIGTSSPAYKLEVLGLVNVVSAPGSYGAMFRARDSVTLGTESFGGVHFTSNPGTDYTIGKWTTAAGAGLLQIRDQSGNKFFTIDGAGNVGIGTTTLSSLLTLHGTYPQLVANNPSTGSGVVIQLKDNGRDAGFMGHSTTTARLQFGSRGIANTQMTLDYNGNLGIGTTSPTRKLHIDGGATTTVGIYIDANGISGTDIEQSSDAFRFQIRDNIPALFYTNNTERIRIASDGNVGIGTSSPVSKLHLDDATAPYITITRTGVPTWQLRNNFPVNQYGFSFNNTTAGTTPLFIGAGGNIGIGTSGPTNRLDVVGGSGTTFNMSNDGDSQRGGKLTFISSSATGRQFYVGTTSAIYNLVFGIDSVEKARIDTAGNLGINTTSPSAKLHVSASASTTAGIFQGVVGIGLTPTSAVPRLQVYGTSTSNAESRLAIYTSNTGTAFNNGLQLAVASDSVTSLINYSNTALYFGTNSTERMRIASDGNVGIGTTSPTISGGGLQVYGSGQKGIRVSGNSSNSYSVEIGCDTTKMSYIQTVGSADRGLQLYTGNASTVVMTLTGSSVGIGTTSPAAKLQILKTGDNGSNGLTDYGIVTVSSGYGTQATLGAEVIGDGYSNLNLGSNIGGVRTFWHISKRLSSASTPHSLEYFYYDGATFNQRFTFTPAGNLGIGTVVPTVKLAVSDGTTVAQVNPYSGVAYFGTVNNYPMALSVNSSEKVRINSDGNVGIGTTVMRSKLEIAGNTSSPPIASVQWTPTARSGSFGIDGTGVYIRNSSNGDYFDLKNASGVARFRVIYDNATHLNTTFVSIGNLSQTGSKLSVFGNTSIGSSYGSTAAPSNGLIVQGSVGIGTNSVDSWAQLKVIGTSALGGIVYVTDKIQALTAFPGSATNLQINPDGGNVGIGTTSPTANLTVYNSSTPTIDFNTGTSTSRGRISATSSDFTLAALTSSPLIFKIDSGEKMRIAADGKVGIGTTKPTGSLHVYQAVGTGETVIATIQEGAGGAAELVFRAGNASTNRRGALRFYSNEVSSTTAQWTVGASMSQSSGDNSFYFYNNGSTSVLTLSQTNVGIGTTSPSHKLDVAGSARFTNIVYAAKGILSDSSGVNPVLEVYNTVATNATTAIIRQTTAGGNGNQDIGLLVDIQGAGDSDRIANFRYYDGSTYTSRMAILRSGNVGIGTQLPAYKLEVNGSLYATRLSGSAMFTTNGKGRFYGTASYALASAGGGSSLTGQTDSVTPFETSLGHQAGNSNTGTGNTAIGYQALFSNTTGTGSIAIGYQALYSNTRGKRNIAIGYEALRTTQGSTDGFGDPIGDENVAIGYQAARAAFNINRVVAIGHRALAKNLAGGNVAIGWLAMESNVGTANSNLGILNTAVGTMALSSNTSGNANSAFGYLALNANTTGNENTAVGHRSMLYNTTGKNNCSFGSYALYYNQIANNNSAFGAFALYSNTTNNNSAFGYKALRYNTTGVNNDAFGYQALYSNISGKGNSAFGFQALKYTTTATGNSAFGRSALTQCSGGGRNSAFGYYSSGAITGNPAFGGSGMDNCSFGYRSLRFNNSGNNNTAVGKDALYNNKVSNQTAIGYNALLGSTTGNGGNTAVGSNAGSAITFGYRNTMIGNNAGATGAAPLTTGQNNTCLGNGAITSTATVSNEITLGNSSITTLRCQVTTITSLSDIRDKDDIIPVDVGLSFIEKLRPVTFKWDKREWYTDGNRDGSKKDTITQIGFIAQELKALQESENATYLNLVYESNPDKLEATPGNLMIPLIKAVQELNAIVKQQRVEFDDKITKQQLEIDYLKSKLNN